MRVILMIGLSLAVGIGLSGCMAEVLTVTAIQGELQAESAGAAMRTLNQVKEGKGQTEVQQAVNAYFGEKGFYPQDLSALVPDYFSSVPTQLSGDPYGYDASSGRVFTGVVAAGSQPTAQDQQYIGMIRQAITAYATQTGYYPGDLGQLVPYYLTQMPAASNGQPFQYNPQTGEVRLPAGFASAASAPKGRSGGFGGGGPMGEAMTGIGIQSELNSMSNSGASGARSRGTNQLNNSTNDHSQRQMDTLNQLGF